MANVPGRQAELRQRTGIVLGRVLIGLRPWVTEVRLLAELSVPQLRAMLMLHASGPLRMGDLASRLSVGMPTVTSLVTKLENKGLVTRQHARDDRRVVMCSCTEEGCREAEQFWDGLQERVNEMVEPLTTKELELVVRGFEIMANAGERPPAPPPPDSAQPGHHPQHPSSATQGRAEQVASPG
ncbi:MAG: MarR family transcriptional regulator [Chloroflexi bacterium]|nr:MarR family transcriptional regulator [Chloroflexota bacterium]